MIRWDEQENGSWQGFSGELLVAKRNTRTVSRPTAMAVETERSQETEGVAQAHRPSNIMAGGEALRRGVLGEVAAGSLDMADKVCAA